VWKEEEEEEDGRDSAFKIPKRWKRRKPQIASSKDLDF